MRSQGAMDEEKNALARLAELIEMEEHATFLAERVRALIRQYGYGAESVLLELAQNADDALEQAAEMRGGGLPRGRLPFGGARARARRHHDPRCDPTWVSASK